MAPRLRTAKITAIAATTIASVDNFICLCVLKRCFQKKFLHPPPELNEAMLYTRNGSCFRWVARMSDRQKERNSSFILGRRRQVIVLDAFRVSAAFENPNYGGAEFLGKAPCTSNPVMKGS